MDQQQKTALAETYFDAATDWDADKRAQKDLELKRWRAGGLVGFGAAVLMGVSVATILPFKQFIPVVIRVDNITGAYDAVAAGEKLEINDSRNEKIIISDVTRYIKAREGFSRGEAEESYKSVYLMSCGIQRAEWDNYFNPQLNKKSPVTVLTNQDADRVTVQSVTFLQSLDENSKTAQVQFEKTIMRGATQPLRYRYVATLRVRYDQQNIPGNQQNFYLNPFGFCADDYRRDQVGNPQTVNAPGTPAQELNEQMERLRQQTDAALAAVRAQQELQRQLAAAPLPASTGTPASGANAASAPPVSAAPAASAAP
jgi:type IV secretion system protein VirB8